MINNLIATNHSTQVVEEVAGEVEAAEAVEIVAEEVVVAAAAEEVLPDNLANVPTCHNIAGLTVHVDTPAGFARTHSQAINIKRRLRTNSMGPRIIARLDSVGAVDVI